MSDINEAEDSGISYLNNSLVFSYLSLLIPIFIASGLIVIGYFLRETPLGTFLIGNVPLTLSIMFIFSISGPIFNLLSMVMFYRGHNKLFLIWKYKDNDEYSWIPLIKKYKKILKIIITNLIISSVLMIIFFYWVIIAFIINFLPNIVYLILSIYYKRRISKIIYPNIIKVKFPQFQTQLQEVQNYMNQNEFERAGKILIELNNQAKSLPLETIDVKNYIAVITKMKKDLIQSEKQYNAYQKIHTSLLMFSKKYPRILLKEIVDDVKMNQSQVERITKQFIKDNLIPAKYDKESQAIEFTFLEGEIDDLMEKFNEWEQTGKGKKI
ncbi:MAG: PCI domain-containing protein [Promethearchaeota archaeon]